MTWLISWFLYWTGDAVLRLMQWRNWWWLDPTCKWLMGRAYLVQGNGPGPWVEVPPVKLMGDDNVGDG